MFSLAAGIFTKDNLLLWILCIVLFVAFTVTLTLYIVKIVTTRKKMAESAAKNDGNSGADPNEIPEDVLIAILTAAAATVYGETKPKFRVVSFRRIYH